MRLITVLAALLLAAGSAAGCGSSNKSSGGSSSTTTTATAKSGALSAADYVKAVQKIHAPVQAAERAYYHAAKGSDIESKVRSVQTALAHAAGQLASLSPPPSGADFNRKLTDGYRGIADRLATVLGHKPFSSAKASKLLVGDLDRTEQQFNDVYTIS